MCAFCKMAISQSGYAAQFVDKDGNHTKFDDIGCMVRYARENNRKPNVAAFFVMDYDDKQWLQAERATFVKSGHTPSPMASGLTAFRNAARAKELAAKNKGRVLQFDELWNAGVAEPSQ